MIQGRIARMRFAIRFFLLIFLAASVSGNSGGQDPVRFSRDIRPILSEKCFLCHGPDTNHREADLRLDIEAGAKDHAIVTGRPDESELFARVTSDDADEQMPPPESGKELTAEEIELLRLWIEQDAPYEGHWSFTAPKRPDMPQVSEGNWIRSAIDRFVLARLDAAKLTPSSEADRSRPMGCPAG